MIFYQYQTVNFALFCGEKRLKKGFGTAYCAFQAIKVVLLHFAFAIYCDDVLWCAEHDCSVTTCVSRHDKYKILVDLKRGLPCQVKSRTFVVISNIHVDTKTVLNRESERNSKTGVQFEYQLFYKMTTLSP